MFRLQKNHWSKEYFIHSILTTYSLLGARSQKRSVTNFTKWNKRVYACFDPVRAEPILWLKTIHCRQCMLFGWTVAMHFFLNPDATSWYLFVEYIGYVTPEVAVLYCSLDLFTWWDQSIRNNRLLILENVLTWCTGKALAKCMYSWMYCGSNVSNILPKH